MNKQRRWQFSLRDVCLLMVIVALAVAWWVDHRRLANELAKERLDGLMFGVGVNSDAGLVGTVTFDQEAPPK